MNLSAKLAAAAIAALTLVPTQAFAQDNPCGGIEVTAIGECHFEFSGGCKAKCTPLNFVAQCNANCDASLNASCTGSCNADCQAACDVDPGSFSCQGSCESECNANIAARCQGEDDQASCQSYCEADCSSQCEAECNVVAPSADCMAKCDASCSGGCQVDANFDCSLDCTASLEGGCEVDCDRPEGALFCDGQYLAVQDIPACLQWLAENFQIEVEFEVEASASVDSSCSVAEPGRDEDPVGTLGFAGLLLGLGFVTYRRRFS